MFTRRQLLAAAALIVAASTASGDGASSPSGLAPADVARLFASEAPVDQERAREAMKGASGTFLYGVLDELRAAVDDFAFLSDPPRPAPVTGTDVAEFEVRWLHLEAAVADRYRVTGGDAARVELTCCRVLAPADVAVLVEMTRDPRRARWILPPERRTVLDGHRAAIPAVLSTVAVVTGYESANSHEASPTAHPDLRNVEERLDALVTPRISRERKQLELSLRTRRVALARPITVERITKRDAESVPVQRPELFETRWSRTVTVESGGSALVVMPGDVEPNSVKSHPDWYTALLVTAKIVDSQSPAPGRVPGTRDTPQR